VSSRTGQTPSLTRRPLRTSRPGAAVREVAVALAIAGFASTVVGIALDTVVVAFSGFLLMLAGVDHVVPVVDCGRLVHRLLQKLPLDPSSTNRR